MSMHQPVGELPQLRFEIIEAARILRMSRATLYERIRAGEIKAQKDGRRRYITAPELQRYVLAKDSA
jgi:excisionase family DNA binding protein